ncbi:MAG: M20/M25/M40 family metallo-hydrolase [Sphaerochaetaceae bacterium]|nr:M20/M25/M40 family metallo-hydrolase [Sphaerochaetaceae bacterium]
MDISKLNFLIDSLYPHYVKVWEDLCNIESPTSYKAGVDAVGLYCIAIAKNHGWQVEVHKEPVSGNAVCITMNPEAKGSPIALSGHMDTVHPLGSFGSPAVRIEGNVMYGPGVTDCKGGIVACLLAMEALSKSGFDKRPVMLLLQSDEENSSYTSEKRTIGWICEKAKDCIAFFNAERHTEGWTVTRRKGIVTYRMTVHGVGTHAMYCYDGASAIREMSHKILELERLQDRDGITVNVGLVNGGSAVNSVPELCTAAIDVRFNTQEERCRADAYVREIAAKTFIEGTRTEVEAVKFRAAMEESERNHELLRKVNSILGQHGMQTLRTKSSGGGSDAADVSSYGIPVIDDFGTEGDKFHTRDEYADIPSLARAAKRIAVVVSEL